jgi:cytochrome c-type biogenesis protein
VINSLLENISLIIENNHWIAPFISLLAGILTSLTPCSMSGVPLVIGFVGGSGIENTKRAFFLSVLFSLGTAVTFSVLGIAASVLGNLMGVSSQWWFLFLGTLMILMSLQIFEIYNFIPSSYLLSKSTLKGPLGALSAGTLAGVFSSPCATPVLVVILGIAAKEGNILWGLVLLLFYSLGHSFFVIIAGTFTGFVKGISSAEKYGVLSLILRYCMGTAVLLIGFYLFYLGF